MKCLLFVSLAVEIYKQPPQIRFYLGDKFIDEMTIEKNTNLEYLQKSLVQPDKLDPNINSIRRRVPDHMFVYEVDVSDTSGTLKVMIDNDDNNFTNGFMTKFTSITLLYLNLIPCEIFTDEKILRIEKYRFRKRSLYKKAKSIKDFYKTRPRIFGNLVHPGCPIKFVSNDGKEFDDVYLYPIGKSGTYLCDITKKYGLYVNKNAKKFRGYYHFGFYEFKNLFDKYRKNENQRDNN